MLGDLPKSRQEHAQVVDNVGGPAQLVQVLAPRGLLAYSADECVIYATLLHNCHNAIQGCARVLQ